MKSENVETQAHLATFQRLGICEKAVRAESIVNI